MIPRYKVKEIHDIWTTENKLNTWLSIEIAHIKALNKRNEKVTEEELKDIIDNVKINTKRWKEIERDTKHDLQAFVQMLEESIPNNSGRWIHYGLTSSDILDTATTILCRNSLDVINDKFKNLMFNLNLLIKREESNKIILSRTHGKAAESQTYRDVFLRWVYQARRAHAELEKTQKEMVYGKLSGASGNYTYNSRENEYLALKELNLKSIESSQIIPRDVYLNYFYCILKIMLVLEKICFDIRMYSIDGVNEMSEPFSDKQKGSSAMPHKKNPIYTENVSGLVRLYKSYFQTAIDNCLTLFERDISHSSTERIIFKDAAHLCCFSLQRISYVIKNLNILYENAEANVIKFNDLISSQAKLKDEIIKGNSRTSSHNKISSNN